MKTSDWIQVNKLLDDLYQRENCGLLKGQKDLQLPDGKIVSILKNRNGSGYGIALPEEWNEEMNKIGINNKMLDKLNHDQYVWLRKKLMLLI
jgi:hypothetical protein